MYAILAFNLFSADGKSIDWFREQFDKIVEKHGWEGWTGSDTQKGRDWRTRVIYRTNMMSSYAAGRYQQLTNPDLLQSRPYWKYKHNDTVQHPRELHKSWDNMVLKYDDPFWQAHYPPNGFGCRCRITAVTPDQYNGLPAPDDGTYTKVDRRGVRHELPNGVDYGWGYAPGASVRQGMQAFIDNKAASLPPVLGQAFLAEVAKLTAVFEPQNSAKLCSKWAVDNDLVDFADYGTIDVAVANAMNQSLFEHLQEFPQLRANQRFIGTAQAQFTRWSVIEQSKIVKRLIDRGYDQASAMSAAKKQVKKPKVNGKVWMQSWAEPSVSGIAVNDKWAKDLPAFTDELDKAINVAWHPVGCNTIKSAVDHEFGHQLDDLIGLSDIAALKNELYRDALLAGIKGEVSTYAGTNLQEFIAECWSEFKNNPEPRRFSVQVARLIKDEYARKFPS